MELFRNSSLPPRERAKDLLSRMTIAEKVGQLNQRLYGFGIYERDNENFRFTEEFEKELNRWGGLGVLYGLFRADPWSARTVENGIPARLAAKAYNLVQKKVIEASRFGIPTLMSTECPHGHQALDGYLLPVCLAMGATFDTDLVKSAFNVVGQQVSSQGADLALVSVLDVLRDPRWGRSEECFGEDPYLCSVMADAVVSGCIDSGVDVVAKHFCAQGEATGGLNAAPASIGDRELR
ncbi:MAG: beta-glucosidase, partial [Oscillospiraceae bacterium]|nr:beta-glucosidase [Oscillospiraceae bacterium]